MKNSTLQATWRWNSDECNIFLCRRDQEMKGDEKFVTAKEIPTVTVTTRATPVGWNLPTNQQGQQC